MPATGDSSNAAAPAQKLRSCAVCRSRKVRCDKLSPCTNCRRANIPCVVPTPERVPRWARRLDRTTVQAAHGDGVSSLTPSQPAPQVLERLRNLEGLVKQLNAQLQQANASAAATSIAHDSDGPQSPEADANSISRQGPGRLASRDAHSSRYVSSSFWTRIKDEIDALDMDTGDGMMDISDSSEQGDSGREHSMPHSAPSMGTDELDRAPEERHAFIFRHNLNVSLPQVDDFRPLPSQIPFLVNVFHDNVNMFLQAVHIPTIRAITHNARFHDGGGLDPSTDALLFSIYYCAVTSMDDVDVLANFGTTKNDLNLRFRSGFEHALARADFLNAPNFTLVQALTLFLYLARRYDSPRYVWMLTGIAIRMAQALGLHRDGTKFPGLTAFEVEMRRRVWWALYMLDLRSSEDQGTDITIRRDSFDTWKPLNINDDEINPNTEKMPRERNGFTDMTIPAIYIDCGEIAIKFLSIEIKDGIPDIEHYGRIATESYTRVYRYGTQLGNARYRMGLIIASLVIAKTTLMLYLPVVSSISDDERAKEVSDKLYISAIELAEYHHELNADQAFKQWRWLFQTYTHWYAIVYILIEISRRPWSPISERAWIALQSPWLIPRYPQHVDRNNQVLVPLRQLMLKARMHRSSERQRLQKDPAEADTVEESDHRLPEPRSSGIDIVGMSVKDHYIGKWRHLIKGFLVSKASVPSLDSFGMRSESNEPTFQSNLLHSPVQTSSCSLQSAGSAGQGPVLMQGVEERFVGIPANELTGWSGQTAPESYIPFAENDASLPAGAEWLDQMTMTAGLGSWLWLEDGERVVPISGNNTRDIENNINIEREGISSWFSLIESAKTIDWNFTLDSI